MLKALGWLIKLSLFTIAVLVAGEWIKWDGRTLSQHVRMQVAQAERSHAAGYLRDTARKVTDDARAGFEKKLGHGKERGLASGHASRGKPEPTPDTEITDQTETQASAPMSAQQAAQQPQGVARGANIAHNDERIAPSERQKLRALIRELNSSHE